MSAPTRLDGDARILVDDRWRGPFGIGRFANEVLGRLGGHHVSVGSRIPRLHPAEPLLLAARMARTRPAVYFSPAFSVPRPASGPVVATIHDLIHLDVAEERSRAKEQYYRHVLRPTLRRAPVVLTVSAFSKDRIVEWLDVADDHVVVVGDGTSLRRDAVTAGASGLDGPYVLYVGNAKPHKNLARLVDAMAVIHERHGHRLVVVGEHPELEGRPGVIGVGSVDDDRLMALYRDAAAVAVPSHYEGFGLPALEALAMGTPLVAADIPPLHEIAGALAAYVDPRSVESLVDGLERTLTDSNPPDAVAHRIARAETFRWDAVAARVEAQLVRAVTG